eukprot:6189051-Pleurochrysis_carterae.AAC.1
MIAGVGARADARGCDTPRAPWPRRAASTAQASLSSGASTGQRRLTSGRPASRRAAPPRREMRPAHAGTTESRARFPERSACGGACARSRAYVF